MCNLKIIFSARCWTFSPFRWYLGLVKLISKYALSNYVSLCSHLSIYYSAWALHFVPLQHSTSPHRAKSVHISSFQGRALTWFAQFKRVKNFTRGLGQGFTFILFQLTGHCAMLQISTWNIQHTLVKHAKLVRLIPCEGLKLKGRTGTLLSTVNPG